MQRFENEPFALIGVNSDDDLEYIRKRVGQEGINWRSFWNGPKGTRGPVSSRWNVRSWPMIYVIDHRGVIRYRRERDPSQLGNPRRVLAAAEALVAEATEAVGR